MSQATIAADAGAAPLKVILCSRRHPSMSRAQFFAYLTDTHAPLLQQIPKVMRYFRKYVQNHGRIASDGAPVETPYSLAAEQDSVIELWFDNRDMFLNLMREPEYVARVRPDEARFNDLSRLVILATQEQPRHINQLVGAAGEVKTFDFIRRRPDLSRPDFLAQWQSYQTALIASEPYLRHVAAHVWNPVIQEQDNPFGTPADYDGVLETWYPHYDALAAFQREGPLATSLPDRQNCFSLVAVERPIYDNLRA